MVKLKKVIKRYAIFSTKDNLLLPSLKNLYTVCLCILNYSSKLYDNRSTTVLLLCRGRKTSSEVN